jgi:hypothetical protein
VASPKRELQLGKPSEFGLAMSTLSRTANAQTLDEKSHRSAAVLLPFVLSWHEELKRLAPTK